MKKIKSLSLSCALFANLLHAVLPDLKFEQYEAKIKNLTAVIKYPDHNSTYLVKLRSQFKLDEVIAGYDTDYEQALAVMNWVHHLWKHNGRNEPVNSDPISILTEVIEHQKQFRCVEYSVVLNGCLNAIGITSRVLCLKTADVETREYGAGHVVVEAYLPSLQKWILLDAQFNMQPTVANLPLNALELQAALAKNELIVFKSFDPDMTNNKYNQAQIASYMQEVTDFMSQYLYYFDTKINGNDWFTSGASTTNAERLMLVPIGAKNPTIFQIKHPLDNMTYTNSAACFYQKPN